jgi:hypothetical protein
MIELSRIFFLFRNTELYSTIKDKLMALKHIIEFFIAV